MYGVVSSAAKASYAQEYGYDEVFVGEFEQAVRAATDGRGVDLALDPVGGETLRASLASLARFGRLVSYGNASGEPAWTVGQPELYPRGLSVAGFSILTLAQTAPEELRTLTEQAFATAVDGTVALPVTAEFGLEEAAKAHRLMGGADEHGEAAAAGRPLTCRRSARTATAAEAGTRSDPLSDRGSPSIPASVSPR